jgi:hypothetical protein
MSTKSVTYERKALPKSRVSEDRGQEKKLLVVEGTIGGSCQG